MTAICRICLGDCPSDARYHPQCIEALFGTTQLPELSVDLAKLHTFALAMVGRTTLSGVQRKISLGLSADRQTLQVAHEGNRFILKPQTRAFPHIPENEHLTMRLAELVGIEVPPRGLIVLADGSIAYVTARFDRPAQGGKLHQEDFCQLAEKPAKEKYAGSAELCVRIVRSYASETMIEMTKLYKLIMFGWWTGNGDMHLKNLSLLTGADGRHRLSPAYDLLCTRLVIEDDPLALPIGGRKSNLTATGWRSFADYCRIPERAAARVSRTIRESLDDALALVSRSMLNDEMKLVYSDMLRERIGGLPV